MAGDDCDSFLAEHRSQRVGTFAAAADVVGIDAIGNLGGYPDRGAPVAPLGAQDDVGGEYAVLLLERDAAVVGGLRDRFGEVRGGLLHATLDDPRAPQLEVLTDQGLNPTMNGHRQVVALEAGYVVEMTVAGALTAIVKRPFAKLHAEIQEVATEVQEVATEGRDAHKAIGDRIDGLRTELIDRIDSRTDGVRKDLGDRIDGRIDSLRTELGNVRSDLGKLQGTVEQMDKRLSEHQHE